MSILRRSELPVKTDIALPLLVPVAAKRALDISVEGGVVMEAAGTAEAGFVPGAAVVCGPVHRLAVSCGELQVAAAAELVQGGEAQVVRVSALAVTLRQLRNNDIAIPGFVIDDSKNLIYSASSPNIK